ncbi:MAG: thioredoxin [Actinomycetota bacterium]|nr:thioredoxin [Actinomycetota bacterium]
MATLKLGKDNFEEVIRSNEIVLVDFWAAWCGPCRYFAPIFEASSEEHPDMVFAKVDTEAERELAAAFGIMSIPTLMVFREQIALYAQPGALPAPALEDLITQVKALDMDDVRRKVAAQAEDGHGAREEAGAR